MGALVTGACGLVGNYLLLRRMTLIGDAISHSILPGLIVAFLVFKAAGIWLMAGAALITGLLTVALIGAIQHRTRLKEDAAICIVFTTMFAIGVILISVLESKGNFHIDADCVLYGEIAFVPLEPFLKWGSVEIAPPSVVRMAGVLGLTLLAITLFYKEWLLTAFDEGFARALGMRTGGWHYALMGLLSIIIVAAFEAVGVILAVAMLMIPPMFAAHLSQRLPGRLVWTGVHAVVSAALGCHLAIWLKCSTAGAMVFVASVLFVIVWLGDLLRARLR